MVNKLVFKRDDIVATISKAVGAADIGATARVISDCFESNKYVHVEWQLTDTRRNGQNDGAYYPKHFTLYCGKASKKSTNPKDSQGLKKPALHMVPAAALYYTALGFMDGDSKYDKYNWRGNPVIASIYVDAALRHLESWLDGEECATDSGVPHLGHAMASIAIIIDAAETGNLVDDRPAPGVAAKLTEKFAEVIKKIAERKAARLAKEKA